MGYQEKNESMYESNQQVMCQSVFLQQKKRAL